MSEMSEIYEELEDGYFLDADDFVKYEPGNKPDFSGGRKTNTEPKKDKLTLVLKIVMILMGVFILVELGVMFCSNTLLNRPKINYIGLEYVSEKAMDNSIGILKDTSWIKFNTDKAISYYSAVTGVNSVSVEKVLPNRINVYVNERKPVARSIVLDGDRCIPVQIDENGVVFTIDNDHFPKNSTVPLVSGLPETILQGMRLPLRYRSLMEQIAKIEKLSQDYFAKISEIKIIPKNDENYELEIYPVNGNLKVLTDRKLDELALQYMLVSIDAVKATENNVKYIDLRYDQISYTMRGDM